MLVFYCNSPVLRFFSPKKGKPIIKDYALPLNS